jgi:hypothetical protein
MEDDPRKMLTAPQLTRALSLLGDLLAQREQEFEVVVAVSIRVV